MSHWATTRSGKILLLGGLAVLLQQLPVSYRLVMDGESANASLVHLHTGLLLAIGMLSRDRWVLPGCYALTILSWVVRARAFGYSADAIGIGLVASALGCAWTVLCGRLMGWPRPPERESVTRADLPRFIMIGLLLFPLGHVLLALLGDFPAGFSGRFSSLIQTLFAKYFGVVVLTLPLVVAWTERRRARPLVENRARKSWLVLLGLGLLASLMLGLRVRSGLPALGDGSMVFSDYRVAVLGVVAWCMLYLRLVYALPLLSLALLSMVFGLGRTAELGNTSLGFFNLLHLALELGIVLMALFYYLVANRDREDLSRRLDEQAQRDSLTGLPNLRALRRQAAQRPHACELACLLLDQADTLAVGYGLGAQSSVMNAVAMRLEAQGVQPCYLGSGQFALLAECGGKTDWTGLLHDLEQPGFLVEGRNVRLLPYLGVARFGSGTGLDMDAALMQASSLAFEARGNNEVEPLYADAAQATLRQAQERMHGASQVLALLRRPGGLQLCFQPLVPLNAQPLRGRSVGEVLCRLSDGQGNLLTPNLFLPAIEAARRGPELDLAVVTELFAQLQRSPELVAACGRISVNLTGQSLASESFRVRLLELLEQAPLPLSRLCFEITETVAIFTAEQASRLLDELRKRGCRIAIDDFGVGMQSFARLKELPVDIIKIDGSFVRNLTRDPRDYAMVQASVAVARACGAEVVAEYVEDEDTAACLRKLGVHWGQGYLYARPMPLREGLCWTGTQAGGDIGEGAEPQPQMNLL